MSEKALRAKLRRAVADYMYSEGCSCCEHPDHKADEEVLAKLLNVPKHCDGSGYNFDKYQTEQEKSRRAGSKR